MDNKRCLALFFGASAFKDENIFDGEAFQNSYEFLSDYARSKLGLGIQDEDILDLFNSALMPSEQIREISSFLHAVTGQVDRIYLHYVGHGSLRSNKDGYFWAIASSDSQVGFGSHLDVKNVSEVIRLACPTSEVVCFVDSCFSGATAAAFQGSAGATELKRIATNALVGNKGTIVISSSPADRASYVGSDPTMTLFTRSVKAVLNDQSIKIDCLSPTQLVEYAEEWMLHNDPDWTVNPQVLAPRQSSGGLFNVPIFPVLKSSKSSGATRHSAPDSQSLIFDGERDVLKDYYIATKELEGVVSGTIDHSKFKPKLYAYYTRTKTVTACLKKLVRKREEQIGLGNGAEDYPLTNISDHLGIRFITLFREEIPEILEDICEAIIGGEVGTEDLFGDPVSCTEVVIYYSRTYADALRTAQDIERVVEKFFPSVKISLVEKAEYSSAHIVLEQVRQNPFDQSSITIPIELQIRSVFEDAWAQVDHRLRYSRTRISASMEDDEFEEELPFGMNVPPVAEKSLKVLKRLLDNAAEISEMAKDAVEPSKPEFVAPSKAMDGYEEFERVVVELGGDTAYFASFSKLLREKDRLDKVLSDQSELAERTVRIETLRAGYGSLAEKINDLFTVAANAGAGEFSSQDLRRYYLYSLQMEEAYCRMFTSAPSDSDEPAIAFSIYEKVKKQYSDFPAIYFRLAQAAGRLGKFDIAIENMEYLANSDFVVHGQSEGIPEFKLTANQRKIIRQNVHRILGFYYWKKSELLLAQSNGRVVEQNYRFVAKALEITLSGHVVEKSDYLVLRELNNIVAYYLALIYFSDLGCRPESLEEVDRAGYEDYFGRLASKMDPEKDDQVQRLDTLACGYFLAGNLDQAQAIARRVQEIVFAKQLLTSGEYDVAEVDKILHNAHKILRGDPPKP